MNRYGDTPLGMVESALEFARIARDLDYHDFVFSMKSSNPKVMIEAYRLLVARLDGGRAADWNYPIHLGVTEAGDGEDGRIKSAIGIGSLLADGIGDTIRVSLTEDSVHEIPVAQALVPLHTTRPRRQQPTPAIEAERSQLRSFHLPSAARRRGSSCEASRRTLPLGGEELVARVIRRANFEKLAHKLDADGRLQARDRLRRCGVIEVDPRDDAAIADDQCLAAAAARHRARRPRISPPIAAFRLLAREACAAASDSPQGHALAPTVAARADFLEHAPRRRNEHRLAALRRHRRRRPRAGRRGPGPVACASATTSCRPRGARIFKTDYVACPSCGRTLFNLQTTTAQIKAATVASQGREDRHHGLHRERPGRNGRCGLRLRRRRAGQDQPLRRQDRR